MVLQKYQYIWSQGTFLDLLEMLHNKHLFNISTFKTILNSEKNIWGGIMGL